MGIKQYNHRSHNKHLLFYHIIFVVKYRKNLLSLYGDFVKNAVMAISENSDFIVSEMEVDKDHIHLMIESSPKLSPLQIVRKLKQEITISLWKAFPELKKLFWKENTFWSDGYFCTTVGNASIETVRKYIESQG